MKIYLSASMRRQQEVRDYAQTLQANGFEITARWLEEPPCQGVESFQLRAEIDRADVRVSDILVRFSDDLTAGMVPAGLATGARHTEVGMALAWRIPVVVVGGHQNVFDYLKEVTHVADIDELLNYLGDKRG